jgi:hypothetical protein
MALTAEENKAVEDGRVLIDKYREVIANLKTGAEKAKYLALLISDMFALKIANEKIWPFFALFDKSLVYNIEALGYDSKEDFDSTATVADKAALETMWK